MSKYKDMFIEESREHLKNINALLLNLEKQPDNQASINTLFREYHSIKGMAASMGYQPIMDLSHSMEDLLDAVRKIKIAVPKVSISLLFSGTDALETMVEDIALDKSIQNPYLDLLQQIRDNGNQLSSDSQIEPDEVISDTESEDIVDGIIIDDDSDEIEKFDEEDDKKKKF